MKLAIPENGKISKESKELMQECITEFIGFVTSEAAENTKIENRKTLNGDDILFAMKQLGFDHYIEPLTHYLNLSRQHLATKNTSPHVKLMKFTDSDLSHVFRPVYANSGSEPLSGQFLSNDRPVLTE